MNKLANGKKRFGIIRWAIILAVIVDCLAVFSYLVTIAIRYYLFGTASDNVFIWNLTIYKIMGSLCGIIIAVISEILYRRMGKLLNGMNLILMLQRMIIVARPMKHINGRLYQIMSD